MVGTCLRWEIPSRIQVKCGTLTFMRLVEPLVTWYAGRASQGFSRGEQGNEPCSACIGRFNRRHPPEGMLEKFYEMEFSTAECKPTVQ